MVSTRQQSNINSSGDNSGTESGTTSKSLRHSSSAHSQNTQCSDLVSVVVNNICQQYISNAKLLDLPHEVLEKIFSYLGFRNVSQLRLVCRHLDRICSAILNSTFQRLQTQMLHRFQGIKAKMPRRESGRRNHPLACESDIIETLHMRLTLLQMSFGKHIERKHCCFFAGEILDEVYRILHYIKVTPKLARPYKVTDELFDLSTMAMEYFKEHIEPTLPEIAYFGSDFLDFGGIPSTSTKYLCLDSPPHGNGKGDESPGHNTSHCEDRQVTTQTNMVLRKRIRKIRQGMKRYNYQLSQLRKEMRHCRSKIADQQKQILEYATRLDEYDKKNDETSRKFSTLLQDDERLQNLNSKSSCQSLTCGRLNVQGFHQDFCSLDHLGKELNKCKTELQYWRSKSPLNPLCVSCGTAIAPVPSEDLEALANQGVLLSEFVAEEPPMFNPPIPGTSADDVWTSWEHEEKEIEKAAEARSKRKSTTSSENIGKNGPTPPKKPRSVLKARGKR